MTAPEQRINRKLAEKESAQNHYGAVGLILGAVSLAVPAAWSLAFGIAGFLVSCFAAGRIDNGKANNLWTVIGGLLVSIIGCVVGLSFQSTMSDLVTPNLMIPY